MSYYVNCRRFFIRSAFVPQNSKRKVGVDCTKSEFIIDMYKFVKVKRTVWIVFRVTTSRRRTDPIIVNRLISMKDRRNALGYIKSQPSSPEDDS